MKAFWHFILAACICFSLMCSCSGGEAFFLTQKNAPMRNTSHGAYTASGHFQLASAHESHQKDSEQCCGTSSKYRYCARIFVSPNKTKTFQSTLSATFSDKTAINCFQLSEKNFISEISNTINPTLASLRTVILLA